MSGVRPLHEPRSAAAVIGALLVVLLTAAGAIWGLFAPRVRYVADPRFQGPRTLPTESVHAFAALAVLTLCATVICLVMAVAAWQIRSARDWQMVLALGVGGCGGTIAGMALGRLIGGGVTATAISRPEHAVMVVGQLPFSWPVCAVGAALGVAVYTVLAAWHNDPLLGRPGSHQVMSAGAVSQLAEATLVTAPSGWAHPNQKDVPR